MLYEPAYTRDSLVSKIIILTSAGSDWDLYNASFQPFLNSHMKTSALQLLNNTKILSLLP